VRQALSTFEMTDSAGAEDRPAPGAGWVAALVPGGVHESLLAAGRIGHPFRDDNEVTAAWVEDRTWWFRSSVDVHPAAPGERVQLRFEGLDGVATVWWDGAELGRHANQHRPAVFDVTDAVSSGSHELLLRFTPPLLGVVAEAELAARTEALRRMMTRVRPRATPSEPEHLGLRIARTRRRKAACSWGWDLGPRVPSIGLHGPVVLERHRHAAIAGVYARTTRLSADHTSATVSIDVEVTRWGDSPCDVRVVLTSPDGDVAHDRTGLFAERSRTAVELTAPQLWWTHDLGASPLYDLQVFLLVHGEVVDTWTGRVGVRSIEVDRSADDDGRLFRFVVNGVPTFARGANWVPASLLVGSVPEQRTRDLVRAAQHAEMTMLRVWGGGIYETDVFYDACDELGILVWQDFMFACDDYPSDDPELTAEVRAEAVHQVQRLRSHTCLALWCGNNEVQGLHELAHGDVVPGSWGWSWFHELLPDVVAQHSPGTPYWPGSPWGEDDTETVNGVRDGDRHAWEVWHGIDLGVGDDTVYATHGDAVHFRRYAKDSGRFISEFGIHAMPELSTLERWTAPGTLALGGPALEHRNKDTPKDKGWAMMEVETGPPTTLQEYVDFSMACQAEGLKLGVEHYRRRQPHCSGTLVWQFNDVWPGLSWSVVDHDLVGKAGYWFLQRAYRPVLASFLVQDDRLQLWVTNSGRHELPLQLEVSVSPFAGSVQADSLTCTARPYSSEVVWSGDVPTSDQVARVVDRKGHAAANRLFLAPLKELSLTGRVRGAARRTAKDAVEVELSATGYAYLARVHSPAPGVRFSTNYLDLPDLSSAVITIDGLPETVDLRELTVASYGQAPEPVEAR
jgi:beta-mannosidase